MNNKYLKFVFTLVLLTTIATVGYLAWTNKSAVLTFDQEFLGTKPKEAIAADLKLYDKQVLNESLSNYEIKDSAANGVEMRTASTTKPEERFTATFPKAYNLPMTIDIGKGRVVEMMDKSSQLYDSKLIYDENLKTKKVAVRPLLSSPASGAREGDPVTNLDSRLRGNDRRGSDDQDATNAAKYLRYQSDDGRKTAYYAYQRDTQARKRKIKNWVYYKKGSGQEKEVYEVKNARLRKDRNGNIEGYYYGEQQKQNDETRAKVDANLYERAMLTLQKELGDDIDNGGRTPDFTIPRPFIIDAQGNRTELDWQLADDKQTLTIEFKVNNNQYPLALDPTLEFTAPGQASEGSKIDGQVADEDFGTAMVSGDFNGDGKIDLAVGADDSGLYTGRAYLFFSSTSMPTTADAVISGESDEDYFGSTLSVGDFNADSKIDLAVGAYGKAGFAGKVYIFYNDGSYPATASTADVKIIGENVSDSFSGVFSAGDYNADGRTDLAVGAVGYNGYTGRTYIFINDGAYPNTASTADIKITGEASWDFFGSALSAGDFNSDGRTDLAIGASRHDSDTGRVYLFYGDDSIPATASTADVKIIGKETGDYFGASLAAGDFNADGKADLAVGAYSFVTNTTGKVYLFYGDGSIPATASTADKEIIGETIDDHFGSAIESGDFNADGRTDLAVGGGGYNSSTGRVYIFYNDGSMPASAGSADIKITGETANNYFGSALAVGDFNVDGKADLAISALGYNSFLGRAYIFNTWNGVVEFDKNVNNYNSPASYYEFGYSLASGDLNADAKTDLIVGARAYSGANINSGRIYIFYNDNAIATNAASADAVITGEVGGSLFGASLATGDFNGDGKADLAVGAHGYATSTGRTYIFYNDGSIPTSANNADVVITGEAVSTNFSSILKAGDFNADGRTDLAVGAYGYSTNTGRAYVFNNDGSIPATASTADIIITGQSTNSYFGQSLAAGDFNDDGKTDLAVGAYGYATNTGRVYIFYNDGSMSATASSADAFITGQSTSRYLGTTLAAGDFNADGKTDIAVGAYMYFAYAGRVYIFNYNNGYATTSASSSVNISAEGMNNRFGYALESGDFNDDGKTDLAASAYYIGTYTGRVYIFYNDGSIPVTAATADVAITGESINGYFGFSLASGDFNSDNKTDLAVGANRYDNYYTGRSYIFYNNEIVTTTASSANIIIDGEATSNNFGYSLILGDFNVDGKNDLAVGALGYAAHTGQVNIFFNDEYVSSNAPADVTITGQASGDYFGVALSLGDYNADGKTDLVVGASRSSSTGRAYIFYNDGSYPVTASSADFIIDGEAAGDNFGKSLTTSDFNDDSKDDLVVGADIYGSFIGRVYIFYNDGSIPAVASTADVVITGEASNLFGSTLETGDFDNDGKTDLAVGGYYHNANTGRVYIFYNDGSIPAVASTADVIIAGETTNNRFGSSLVSGDFNADSKIDLAVGANLYNSNTGRAYVFYNDGTYPVTASTADLIITGESTNNYFGSSLAKGDFNADSKTDLAVGAYNYNIGTGRAYIFYNDGSIPTTAALADITITGDAIRDNFGNSLIAGDVNTDSNDDLVVGSEGGSKAYYIIMKQTSYPQVLPNVILKGKTQTKGRVIFY